MLLEVDNPELMDILRHLMYVPGKTYTALEKTVEWMVSAYGMVATYYKTSGVASVHEYDVNSRWSMLDRFRVAYKPTDLHLYHRDYHRMLEGGYVFGKRLQDCTLEFRR